ncbi:type I restriction endonuclease [Actinobacillus equuli]|uniref:type I restriction endonuclease n=1 Tax=Actinobacillus equuli TaxID=718 RepID=UPI0024412EC1|nr:type I restriction endonuclease [Actinobacillus equuli]WGE42877.1 type I restriction endonuclease [Actinobacillus equuli subsp. haemolyticus]WGE47255.1 type I restriction endonuclease [Actinobacillus equuli subsp. haemolyticus]WGE51476.1 type I restriction endonuclease [Actinobacillus equuli subsp. haemolyticus]WGE53596.1 type I restriction endonuclease [Actinobacillus equuli subsp. haemolyticus]WGE74032.1 type I restriction endonuclease [Actinobacillus equuli subsp. haemolyticus]
MNQNIFKEKVLSHIQHVIKVGSHCSTEETTKQALILPLLDILGFNPYDPTKVRAEYGADFPGVKNGERVDYALFCHDVPVMFIEAKSYNENLSNHVPQLARYFNATPEVTVAAVTNGREWRFFTDLKDKNIMDESPFLRINFENVDDSKINQLSQFCHDRFQPEALRTLAEESVYLSAFTKTISESLKEVDSEFVRYVAGRSNVGRQLNQRFIDAITPIVKQAVEKAVSAMVVSGLSRQAQNEAEDVETQREQIDEKAPIVDSENNKIITTYTERQLFDYVVLILGESVELVAKDTESYFSILFQGKSNRWILRYFDNKQHPCINVPLELLDIHRAEIQRAGLDITGSNIIIDRPENILRISGLIRDCLVYCQNDENFARKK